MHTRGEVVADVTRGVGSEVTVLHPDDERGFLTLAADRLEAASERLQVVSTTDPEQALARIGAGDVDCVVSERHPDLPFLPFTGRGSEQVAEAYGWTVDVEGSPLGGARFAVSEFEDA